LGSTPASLIRGQSPSADPDWDWHPGLQGVRVSRETGSSNSLTAAFRPRGAGADRQVTTLIDRLPAGSLFGLFLKQGSHQNLYSSAVSPTETRPVVELERPGLVPAACGRGVSSPLSRSPGRPGRTHSRSTVAPGSASAEAPVKHALTDRRSERGLLDQLIGAVREGEGRAPVMRGRGRDGQDRAA
jgi:hypothetical protein